MDKITNQEILRKICELEKDLFDLRFKMATKQTFKSHEFKIKKRKIKKYFQKLN